MSATLAKQQTALLDLLHLNTTDLIALYAEYMPANGRFCYKNPAFTLRGLRAYRANAQALAVSALQSCYPTLQQLIGEENFSHLVQDFWQARPPVRGDLAQWGSELPAYLCQVPQLQALLQGHAYLPDVAKLEWALHIAATASDAALDAESFQLLTSHDPAQIRLKLSPGCAVLRSGYPLVACVQLHHERTADTHAQARQSIADAEPQTALVWRQGFRPMFAAIDAASAALVETTLQGQSLADALDAALSQAPDFDFSECLATHVQAGLLMGAAQLD
jgi:hypothetical protein